jgi:hypothetical protein
MSARDVQAAVDGARVFSLADAWPDPDMTTLVAGKRAAPIFPMEVLGERWGEWVTVSAESKSAPVDYVAMGLLTTIGALIGTTRLVSPWDGWTEPPVIWGCIVGNPSAGKSPALDTILGPARRIEEDLADDIAEKLRAWEADRESALAIKEAWKLEVKEAIKIGTPPPPLPEKAIEPEKPIRPRIAVSDATIEAIATLLAANPRGLLMSRDELAGWISSFDRYSGGGDREFWLEAFGGRSYVIDRKGKDEPIRIPSLSVCVLGSMQPDKLASCVLRTSDDGFAARFLWCWPDAKPPLRPRQAPDPNFAYEKLSALLALSAGDQRTVTLEDSAADLFDQWRRENAKAQDGVSGPLLSHYGKLPGYLLRLALILEYLDWTLDASRPPPETVSYRSIVYAAELADEYFAPMAARCFGDASLPTAERGASAIARHIRQNRITEFNARNARREWRLPNLSEADPFNTALNELIAANIIRPDPSREGKSPGRAKLDYTVNPKFMEAQ